MKTSMIRYIFGTVLKILSLLMLLPCLVALWYKEMSGIYFLFASLLSLGCGFLLAPKRPADTVFYLKDGCIATAGSWILMSLFGCLPFLFSGEIPSFTDALFETISGFTTTGASILTDIEALSNCMLFWRSFTHWIGGMGVLVFLLAIIPMSGGSHINLMRAESSGPSVGKLVPKLHLTAKLLYSIYLGMSLLLLICLLLAQMPFFEAINVTMATAGTGGFSIRNDSCMSYSPTVCWIITIFMILFSVNFNAYYLILFREFRKAFSMEEVRMFFFIILTSGLIIFFNILDHTQTAFDALTHAFFQVATIISTTGFATMDFDQWNQTAKIVLVFITFCGGCAGSTGGGIKVSRLVIALKTIVKELSSYIYPHNVRKIKMDGKPLGHEVVRSVNVYFITFTMLFCVSLFIISFENKDMVTNFTAVAAIINNVGPGLALVGPTQNFGHFTDLSKFVLMFDMLAGRLELFPLLTLFHPLVWREAGKKIYKKM